MINVLITTQMMLKDKERWSRLLASVGVNVDFYDSEQRLNESDCMALPVKYSGWIAGDDEITAPVLDRLAPTLSVISKWGAGIDSIDKAYAESIGVKVMNTPGAFATAVSEIAVGYVLTLTREILTTHSQVTSGNWPKTQHKALDELAIGILGYGAIGSAVGARLKPFGCQIAFADPYVDEDLSTPQKVATSQLFNISNIVIVTCPLTANTVGSVGASLLRSMPRPSYLVNVSRGPIVNESDLVDALADNTLSGAALDVYETEPLPLSSSLRSLNVVLGSHNANNTQRTVELVHESTIRNLLSCLSLNYSDLSF